MKEDEKLVQAVSATVEAIMAEATKLQPFVLFEWIANELDRVLAEADPRARRVPAFLRRHIGAEQGSLDPDELHEIIDDLMALEDHSAPEHAAAAFATMVAAFLHNTQGAHSPETWARGGFFALLAEARKGSGDHIEATQRAGREMIARMRAHVSDARP